MRAVFGMQSLIDVCRGYEVEIHLVQPYHARAVYQDQGLFDFYPKSKRFYNLQENNFKSSWHTLGADWKDDIHRMLSTFLWTGKIYPLKQDSDLWGGVWEVVKEETKERYKYPHVPKRDKYNHRSNPFQQD